MTSRIEFRQLQALHAVLQTRSMTLAARMLGISQPAVSSLIARLEQETGLTLFARQGGLLQPTAQAIGLFEAVSRAVSGFENVGATVEAIKKGTGGRLRIAAQPLVGLSILPDLIARFRLERPDVTVSLQTTSSLAVRHLLAGGLYDLGIAEMPVDPGAERIESFALTCVCILPKGHRLADAEIVTPSMLSGEPFVASMPERAMHHRVGEAFREAGSSWNVVCEVDLFSVACRLVARGAGVGVVDPFTAASLGRSEVVTRPFEPAIAYEFALYRPNDRPLTAAARDFGRLVAQAIAAGPV